MDNEQKQDLRQNDLAEFLGNFGTWCKEHRRDLTLSALIVLAFVVVFGGRWYLNMAETRERENAWAALDATALPASQARLAAEHKDKPMLHHMALNAAGYQLLYETVFGLADSTGLPADQPLPPDGEHRVQLEQAADYFRQVIAAEHPADPPYALFRAHFGLATTLECLGDFDGAQEQYNLIREQAERYELKHIATMADIQLAHLADTPRSVVLPKAPPRPETPEPTTDGDESMIDITPDLDITTPMPAPPTVPQE